MRKQTFRCKRRLRWNRVAGRLAWVFCTVLLLSALLPVLPCGASAETVITSKDQLNQPVMQVGVSTGSAYALIVEKELPNAQIVYYEENTTAYEAVAQGKIDAYVFDRVQMQLAINSGRRGVHMLDESMDETVQVAVGISPRSAIPDFRDKLAAFISEIKADGTLAEMYSRWTKQYDTAMPAIDLPENPKYHLTVGTAGIVPPYSYYENNALNGFDIEMANRFAAWLDASLAFKVYDFGAIVPAAISGDVDCIMSNLNVTEERKEAISFSEVIYENTIGIMVRGDAQGSGSQGATAISSVDQLHGKVIGSATGTTYDEIVKRRLPDVTFSYFNTYSDMVAALKAGKIAAFACDEPVLKDIMAQDSRVAMLPEYLDTFEYGFIFGKDEGGEALCDQMSEFIRGIKEDGTLSQLTDQWLGGHMDAAEMSDIRALSGENGTLTLALDALNPPFEYMRGDAFAGFEVELAIRFCEQYGYALDIRNMDFDAILTSVQTGKADFGASTISITEERKQNVAFCEPYYSGGTVMVVLKAEDGTKAEAKPSFREEVKSSFTKTFVREDRWQLFLKGVVTTLTITVASILSGTALGFVLFMLCRNGNAVANAITRFSFWLVQGMPMVVLLMILYYVIFGSVAINGIAVAVIGFTLTFGSSVFGLLKLGVGAVDVGQYEAAYALGYSNRRTFFRIILPQALPHVLPAYKGEIVGLIKATAVVGYIAVQDLTKMGDIVRSRTYEAFFPLIAVTFIYFVLEGIIRRVISLITVHTNPKRRKPKDILKGVKTDDQN